MATQTKATATKAAAPAPAAAPKAAEAPKSEYPDFGALTLEDAPTADLARSRTTILDRSPVLDWLRKSKEEDKAKAVTVPKGQGKGLERLLRSGADRLKIGVSVTVTADEQGNERVSFLAKERRAYVPRKSTKDKAAE